MEIICGFIGVILILGYGIYLSCERLEYISYRLKEITEKLDKIQKLL